MNNLNNIPGTGTSTSTSPKISINNFPEITFKSQNVRSFNISNTSKSTELKMLSLIKEKDDVIFVSDTRLNTDIQKSALNNLEKNLLFGGYDCFFNSETSNRGTGILIKNKLNYTIISKECDIGGNFILLKLKIENKPLIIGSIYGPNINENIGVYEELTNKLSGLECETIVLGGDWNCTVDCRGTDSNLDVLNMVSIPSKIRSEKVKKICEKFKLVDPFRTLHPTKLEFTYIPAIIANTNRSRLDFFLVSESVFGNVSKCRTTNSLTCTSFDHKPVNLSFKKIKKYRQNQTGAK